MTSATRTHTTPAGTSRAPEAARLPTVALGGIPICRLSFDASIACLGAWLDEPGPRRVATANLDFLEQARTNAELRSALCTADMVTADGTPLVWLSRLKYLPIVERVAGSDFVPRLIAEAARRRRSVYLLGGQPGVGEACVEVLRRAHPDLIVAGHSSPMISLGDSESCASAVRAVRESRADLVLVALGCPKQDVFLARHAHELGCRVGIGVGATLDFIAGRVRRAPRFLGPLGAEWLFRWAQEPRRLTRRYSMDLIHMVRLTAEAAGARKRA